MKPSSRGVRCGLILSAFCASVPSTWAQNSAAGGYVDASGAPAGNTVSALDDDPSGWYAIPPAATDQLWGLLPLGRDGTMFEAGAGGGEDAPLLRTRLSGLMPGETYALSVHYGSALDANWSIRAGLSPQALSLFDRLGQAGATPGGASILNLDFGFSGQIRDPLGGPAFSANGGAAAVPDIHDLWNGVAVADITAGLNYADGSAATGIRVNVGRQDDSNPDAINWNLHNLLTNAGGQPEGLQRDGAGAWASPVLHTYLRENAAGSSPRDPAFAIENLAVGIYDLYVVADNSFHSAAAGDNRSYHVYAGVGETSGGTTPYTGFPRQTITNAEWAMWKASANYARFTLTVRQAGQDIIVASREVSGLDNNSLVTCAQLVPLGAQNRIELIASLGETTADASGNLSVYIDDKPAGSGAERSWYDGVSYRHVPTELAPPFVVINDNAGWCWFQDERAIVHDGKLIVGSAANSAGTDGANRSGNIEIATYDLATRAPAVISVLHEHLQNDDHDDPAIHVRSDGRYLAVYSRHGNDRFIRTRISEHPGDSTTWQPEVVYTAGAGATYANVFRLADENNGLGRTYDFYRGEGFNPNFIRSDDDGTTWSYGGRLIAMSGQRPYVKYASNHRDEIHFAYTEGHPGEYDPGTGLYHAYLKGGKVYRSDGTLIRDLSIGPIAPQEGTQVFSGAQGNRAWIADLHLDAAGRPYLAYSVHKNNGDHRYRYARWDGQQWRDSEIAFAGQCLYATQVDYTGLVALDPGNPNRLWISTNADPVTGEPLMSGSDGRRHWELYRGDTNDGGATWSWKALTAHSRVDHLRPIMPAGDGHHTALLWLLGTYSTYTSYDLDAVAVVIQAADFNADFVVDGDDLTAFVACLSGASVPYDPAGLPAECTAIPDSSGRIAPDFDRDGDVDQADFGRFQSSFGSP